MKFRIIFLVGLIFSNVEHFSAATLSIGNLPVPDYLDTEVSTNVALRALDESVGGFSFSMQLSVNATNSLMLAFGCDRNGDGNLSEDEFGMTAGWDSSEWFVESKCNDERLVWSEVSDGSVKRFAFDLMIRKSGNIRNVQIKSGDSVIHSSVTNFPSWFYEQDWNLAKIIARGKDVSQDWIVVDVSVSGFHLILR